MNMPRTRWRPELFGALGAGFATDATVQDGVHLRWYLDPRLGLPLAVARQQFRVFFLRTRERTVERVDLFKPSVSDYPIHSSVVSLGPSAGSLAYENGSIYFTRPLYLPDWEPVWRYRLSRMLSSMFRLDLDDDDRALQQYMDEVMGKLDVRTRANALREQEDVVAVDMSFRPPLPSADVVTPTDEWFPTIDIEDGLAAGGAGETGEALLEFDPSGLLTTGTLFDHLRPQVYATVRGYDRCDRLVAQDWVGKHARVEITASGTPPTAAGGWKLIARLRAPGIRRIEVQHVPSLPALTVDEVRWMFCDEYASADPIWQSYRSFTFDPRPAAMTALVVSDAIYEPFRAGAANPTDMAHRIRTRFLEDPAVKQMLKAPDSFAMYRFTRELKDVTTTTGTADDVIRLPLLSALTAATVDPVVANIMGFYGYVAGDELNGRDWKVEVVPPFFGERNLERLDRGLRATLNPGRPFFHLAGDSLTNLSLAGLVLNAVVDPKPAPARPAPSSEAETQIFSSGATDYKLFVSAAVSVGDPGIETKPYLVSTSYEVTRVLTGESPQNIITDEGSGPLDDVGILPDVVLPDHDAETCQSKARVIDTFSRPANMIRDLSYGVRGFDIFGRPSEMGEAPRIELRPPCLAPPSPTNVSSLIDTDGSELVMQIVFSLGRETNSLQAVWNSLEILIHPVSITEGVSPADTTWSGSRYGRQLELGFNPADRSLQTSPVTESCRELHWVGSTLVRSAAAESSCSPYFSGPAKVGSEVYDALSTSETGLYTYRAELPVGSLWQFPTGLNAWCARLRVRGTCPLDGTTKHSIEVCTRATRMITPPPPEVVQPPLQQIPLSTYPDAFGNSYFGIDLRPFLLPADHDTRPLVRIFLARLSRLTDNPGALVQNGVLSDPTGLISLAKGARLRFSLLTDPPHEFDPDCPRFDVQVPGELEEVYIVTVTGCNEYLEEGSWQNAAFVVFRTPTPRPAPIFRWVEARPHVDGGGLRCAHSLVAQFAAPIPDPAQPPRAQLFRQNLSTRASHADYLQTVTGTLAAPAAAAPEYVFQFTDDTLDDWNRYTYQAQLLEYATHRGQHVKTLPLLVRDLATPWSRTRDALGPGDTMSVAAGPGGGFVVSVECAAGDFDFSLTKIRADGSRGAIRGRIERGQLYFESTGTATLDVGPRYRLRFEDPDPAAGTYTFRLMFGQQMVWAKKAVTP